MERLKEGYFDITKHMNMLSEVNELNRSLRNDIYCIVYCLLDLAFSYFQLYTARGQ